VLFRSSIVKPSPHGMPPRPPSRETASRYSWKAPAIWSPSIPPIWWRGLESTVTVTCPPTPLPFSGQLLQSRTSSSTGRLSTSTPHQSTKESPLKQRPSSKPPVHPGGFFVRSNVAGEPQPPVLIGRLRRFCSGAIASRRRLAHDFQYHRLNLHSIVSRPMNCIIWHKARANEHKFLSAS
jgi:hypothetical protein